MHFHVTLQPLYSDGVTVTPDAPVSDGLVSASVTDSSLTFSWDQFIDPSIVKRDIGSTVVRLEAAAVVSRHEWTLLVDNGQGRGQEHLYTWTLVKAGDIDCTTTAGGNNSVSFVVVHKQLLYTTYTRRSLLYMIIGHLLLNIIVTFYIPGQL